LFFGAAFLPLFAVFLWLYPRILPGYQQVVVATANPVLGALAPPFEIAVDVEGGWIASLRMPGGAKQPFYGAAASDRHLLYLNLALLPALLLATPVSLRHRLRLLVLGGLLMFLLHVAAEIGLVRAYVCLDLDPGAFFCAWLREHLQIAGQLFAVLLWAGLTFSYWLPRRPDASIATSPRSDDQLRGAEPTRTSPRV